MTFVLLRGLGRESGHWGNFSEILQKTFPDAKVLCLDVPGSGKHLKKKSSLSLTQTVEELRSEWIGQKKEGKQIIIGISLGGMTALEWTNRYPTDFDSAVIINSSLGNLSSPIKRLQLKSFGMFAQTLIAKTPEKKEKAILEYIANHPEAQREFLPVWTKVYEERPIAVANLVRQIISAARFTLKEKPKTSFLVLASTHDRLCHPSCSVDLAQFLEAPLYFHPTAGHDLTTDDGAWVANQIQSFLKNLK